MATILITGANGTVSTAAIRALQGQGHRLIGLVRDPAKAKGLEALGVEPKVGDLDKLRSVESLFEGIDVAWLLTPPGPNAPYQSSNALWAARRGGAKHVVRLSAVGAAHDAPTLNSRLHALSDAEVMGSGLQWTILKPHFFMSNLLMYSRTIAADGVLTSAFGETQVPMIDPRDVGAVAAKVLAAPAAHAGKTYTLTGAPVTMAQVAAAVSEAAGRPVKSVPVAIPALIEGMAKFGADDYRQVSLRDYFEAYASGWNGTPTADLKQLLGRDATSVAGYARDFAGAFGKK